jgi:hypothetical protein
MKATITTTPLPEQPLTSYLAGVCGKIQSLDKDIRFVGIADYAGELMSSFYRSGLRPLMDIDETAQYALQTVFRAKTRGGFTPRLGDQSYAVTTYQRLIRATITIQSRGGEHHNLYVLVSLDKGASYPYILEHKIIPFITRNKDQLFLHTSAVSKKYKD